ncbi:unnamed protein product [Dovyalis caffra]|uniref:Secreted protein n=1 Tax=Dovyalis caffra TaxID=77055 RepID=A0AAV1RMB4_9ROSI|nr:unnamed protein product [Dovyalis caffra]
MANAACTCLFFLLMLLSYDILCVEGRSLGLRKRLKHAKCCNPEGKSIARNTKENNASKSNPLHHTIKTSEGVADAFRVQTLVIVQTKIAAVNGQSKSADTCTACARRQREYIDN